MILEIKDLHVNAGEKEIISGLSLTIKQGEMHVIMGPNGSGKSTLAKAIFGHPGYKITSGDILVDGKSVLGLKTDERAKLGLFLQFQDPVSIEGVKFLSFLNTAKRSYAPGMDIKGLMQEIKNTASELGMGDEFIKRALNYGFSGGEKKKSEILQLAVLKPKIAILDEPDSGLDVDAIKVVAGEISKVSKQSDIGVLLITHYSRILSHMEPQFVHIMVDGRIVESGGTELIKTVESVGYDSFAEKAQKVK